jgi:hypothetical protein
MASTFARFHNQPEVLFSFICKVDSSSMHLASVLLRDRAALAACVESKVGTAETEMDEGKPAAVTALDSETDSEQRAVPDVMDKM